LAWTREIAFSGGTYSSRFAYDARTSRLKTKAELHLDGEVHELLYAHYVMTSGALVAALEHAGFAVLSLCSDTDDRVYEPGCPRLLIVAELAARDPSSGRELVGPIERTGAA
jgi:hypothetical protein